MRQLALDIWDDLRARRLHLVAGALLVALIAIPVFVMKPAPEDAPTPVKAPPRQGQTTSAVARVDDSPSGSRLGVFRRKDPFRPPAGALEPAKAQESAGASKSVAGPSPASPPASPGASSGAGSGSVSKRGSGGSRSSGGGAVAGPSPVVRRPRTAYTHVIDVDFGLADHARLRRGVTRLEALPNERAPMLLFLGVSARGGRAVFMIDPTLKQRGQGTCRPSPAACRFLHLSTDPGRNGHYVAGPDGVTYLVRLKAIRRVTVRQASRMARRGAGRAGAGSAVFSDEQR